MLNYPKSLRMCGGFDSLKHRSLQRSQRASTNRSIATNLSQVLSCASRLFFCFSKPQRHHFGVYVLGSIICQEKPILRALCETVLESSAPLQPVSLPGAFSLALCHLEPSPLGASAQRLHPCGLAAICGVWQSHREPPCPPCPPASGGLRGSNAARCGSITGVNSSSGPVINCAKAEGPRTSPTGSREPSAAKP